MGKIDPVVDTLGRTGPVRQFGLRRDDAGAAGRSCVHRPYEIVAVRGPFQRVARWRGQRGHAVLRRLSTEYDVLLVYDEVITGFRYAPGGYQEYAGVMPDMTVLGKVVTGGMPGSALVGRADIMQLFNFTGDPHHDRYERVHHLGTFNANPLAAASGIATLKQVATGEPQAHADRLADRLRQGMDDILEQEQAAGYVYGDISLFHVYMEAYPGSGVSQRQDLITNDATTLKGIPKSVVSAFQKTLLGHGIDLLSYTGGATSAAHTDADIDHTLDIFRETIQTLLDDQVIARIK